MSWEMATMNIPPDDRREIVHSSTPKGINLPKGLRSMQTPRRRTTLNSSRSPGFRPATTRRLGGVVIRPGTMTATLHIALIGDGDFAEDMVGSWEIGDGRSVALILVTDDADGSRPPLRILA